VLVPERLPVNDGGISYGQAAIAAATMAVLAVACEGRSTRSPAGALPPNIALFVIDTLRADHVGCYGSTTATPHADRMSRRGVLVEDVTSSSSWTRPAMASLLTGLPPAIHKVESRLHALGTDIPLLPELLAQAGYRTAFVTTNPNVGSAFGFSRGFESTVELYSRRARGVILPSELVVRSDAAVRAALPWLERVREPHALVMLTTDPHDPYDPPLSVCGGPAGVEPQGPGVPESESIGCRYAAEVTLADHSLGLLLRALERRRRARETLVVLVADHGEEFWEHGQEGHGKTLYQESVQVPLILAGSARAARSGARLRGPGNLTDVLPTLLAAAGAPRPDGLPGVDLLAAGSDTARPIHARVAIDGHDASMLRRDALKLVHDRRAGTTSLFDLESDPSELHPLRDAPVAPSMARELAALDAGDGRSPVTLTDETPAELEDALRALGYVADD